MLYERWREIARGQADEIALHDLHRGVHWTFAQLAAEAEQGEAASPVVFPQGAELILELLRAWRLKRAACPLEKDQAAPGLSQLPPNFAHLKMTSATGGVSRLVAFTEEQLAADADNIVATMGLRREWPNLGVISLAHSYGFSNLVLPLLLHGIPLILAESPLPENVRCAAAMVPDITLAAVPALWNVWHQAHAMPANIRLAISAGAPLSVPLEQAVFTSHGLKIHNFYGSSECGGIAYDASEMPRTDASLAGAPMKNVRLSLGGDGCLQVRGQAVAETYWPEPSPSLAGGCFSTSDLAEIKGEEIYLRGRAGDQINLAGRKVSPEDIEKVLLTHPEVRECLVFGAPDTDAQRNDTIVACVASDATAEALKQFLLKQLPAWQIPREWLFVKSLEANSRGKLSRAEWRRKFLSAREKS
jgi:acyl-CoA synthetase (AMP-forming)/AMP-acid ligase II